MTAPFASPKTSAVKTDEIDLGRLLSTLWRGKLWIFLSGLFSLIAGGYYAFEVATPMYTTTATVVQEEEQDPVVDFSGGLGGSMGADQSAINTQIEVLRSRDLLEKLVDELGLMADPEFNTELQTDPLITLLEIMNFARTAIGQPAQPERVLTPTQIRDAVVDNLRDALSVANVRQSYVYTITATTEDPQKSMRVTNKLAELYIRNQLDVKAESNLQATAWLTDRLGQLRVELETSEAQVKDFNAQTDLINADTLAALNRQVKELRERLDGVRVAQAELSVRIASMEAAALGGDAQQMAALAEDLTLDRRLSNIDAPTGNGRAAFDERFSLLIAQDKLERDRLGTQVTALEQSIAQQERQTEQQSADLITLQQLEREAEASGLLYEYFLSRLKETSVQSGIQTPDSRVLSRAVEPLLASSPRKPIVLAMSLVLGLIVGAAFVLLREMSQNTFRAAEELETRTGYNVLGQIPKIPARRRGKLLKYLADKPTSVAAEAVRNMRTSVLLTDVEKPPQIIMSTSSIPGEGKTTQSLALTQNLAGLGKSVLLIEGDVRKRIFAEYFEIKDQGGFMAVLEGKLPLSEAVHHEPSLKADVLMSEQPTANAADLFSSQAFVNLVRQARKEYDYIVIDTPPVLAVPDARIIGKHVDTTLYTVRWDHTTHRQVTQGLKELAQVNIKIAGLVLGQIDQKGLKRYGYGDQAYGYGGYHTN